MITIWEFFWPLPIVAFGYAVWEPNMLTFLIPVLLILVGNYIDTICRRWTQAEVYEANQLKGQISGKKWIVNDDFSGSSGSSSDGSLTGKTNSSNDITNTLKGNPSNLTGNGSNGNHGSNVGKIQERDKNFNWNTETNTVNPFGLIQDKSHPHYGESMDYYSGMLEPDFLSYLDPHNPLPEDGSSFPASLPDGLQFTVFKTTRCWRSFKAVPLPKDVYRVGNDVFTKDKGNRYVEAKDFVCPCDLCTHKGPRGSGVCVFWSA